MRKPVISVMTLCLLIFFLLFFSFVHSLFRLQLFKHVVSAELVQKLQVETLKMKEDYESIEYEAVLSHERIMEGGQKRSELVVAQIAALIASHEENEGSLTTPEQAAHLKALLADYNTRAEQCFWIVDAKGTIIAEPPEGLTDVQFATGIMSVDWKEGASEGVVLLQEENRETHNPGYGKRITAKGWLLVAFQPWGTLKEKGDGVESLKKMKIDRLISHAGIRGSAGIVDASMRLKEYNYTPLETRPADDIYIESKFPASVSLFNKRDGVHEYVMLEPNSNRANYRETYVDYDEKTGNHYFVSRDIRTLFNGIDRRSSPMLVYQAALTFVMFFVSIAVTVWEMLMGKRFKEESE